MTSVSSEISEKKWHIINARRNEILAAKAVRALQAYDLEILVIKGIAAAEKYPHDHPRVFADIDIAVSIPSFSQAAYLIKTDATLKGLVIDLHSGLRHLDTLPFERIYARSRIIAVDGVSVRVPSEEDHLRILAVHWLNDGGEFRERLFDVYYAVSNRGEDFNWEICLDPVSERRRKWVIYTIGLAHRYLGLEIDDLPFAAEAKELPHWLVKRVDYEWEKGIRLIPLRAVKGNKNQLFQQIKKRVFPNPIQAIIDVEGDLDSKFRIFYQVASVAKRAFLMLKGAAKRQK